MGVRELPSGRWQARVMIDGRPWSATCDTREAAAEWIVLTRAQAITGTLPSSVTVRNYAARWLATYDSAPVNTRRFHAANVPWVVEVLGPVQVGRVVPSDIARMIEHVKASRTVALADRVYRTCSALFAAAVDDGLAARSPVRSRKHRPRRQAAPHVVLERVQAREVLLQLRGWQRDTAVLQLGLGTRFGEVAGLTPHDRRPGDRIAIARRVSSDTVRATKNHRHRVLELPRMTLPTLDRLAREALDPPPLPDLADRELPVADFDRRWLIQTATGRPANLGSFNAALRAACRAVGAPVVSSHGLRHTYVSWMIDDGHSADLVAFWIGDTPETVRRVYAHMLEGSSSPAAASIDAALGGLDAM